MIAKLNSKFEVAHFINGNFVGDKLPEWIDDLKENNRMSIDSESGRIFLYVGIHNPKIISYKEVYLVRRYTITEKGKKYIDYPQIVTVKQFNRDYEIIE